MNRKSFDFKTLLLGLISLPTPLWAVDGNPDPTKTPETLANHIAEILISLAIPLAVVGVFWTAYTLLSSQGDPAAFAKAKKNATNIIIGALLILFAVVIFNYVYSFFRTSR